MERNWKKGLAVGAAALLTLALLVGAGIASLAAVSAQTPPPAAPAPSGPQVVRAAGKITARTADGFTMDTRQGSVNVTVNAQTWIVLAGQPGSSTGPTEGTLSALKPGMVVEVAGTGPAAGQIAARVVREAPGKGFGPGRNPNAPGKSAGLTGTLSGINGAQLTVTLADNRQVQVSTDANTLVLKNGVAGVADLKVGDQITVNPALAMLQKARAQHAPGKAGRPGKGGFFNGPPAGSPEAAPANPAPPANTATSVARTIWVAGANETLLGGVVQSVNGSTLELRSPQGKITVQVDPTATLRRVSPNAAATTTTLSDVQPKTLVLVVATAVAGQPDTYTTKVLLLHSPPGAAPTQP